MGCGELGQLQTVLEGAYRRRLLLWRFRPMGPPWPAGVGTRRFGYGMWVATNSEPLGRALGFREAWRSRNLSLTLSANGTAGQIRLSPPAYDSASGCSRWLGRCQVGARYFTSQILFQPAAKFMCQGQSKQYVLTQLRGDDQPYWITS